MHSEAGFGFCGLAFLFMKKFILFSFDEQHILNEHMIEHLVGAGNLNVMVTSASWKGHEWPKRKFSLNTTSSLSPIIYISSAQNDLNIILCQYTVNNEDESVSFNTELRGKWLIAWCYWSDFRRWLCRIGNAWKRYSMETFTHYLPFLG